MNVFRFHAPFGIADSDKPMRLIKRKMKINREPQLIASDSASITDANGRRPIESYSPLSEEHFITLTCKEADLIALANPGMRPPRALEALHPWLPQQNYHEDSDTNYRKLRSLKEEFGQKLFAPASFCDEKWNKVCNAIRITTPLDARFYSAWHLPIQDTYVLEEKRPSRAVIAIDFNAMYPSCMQQKFPNPSRMRHVIYERDVSSDESLPSGLFRCTLYGPASDFIRKYNPFRAFFSGRYLAAALKTKIVVDLNEFEVEFYLQHFDRIRVNDAVISDESIPHPLARDAKRSFANRMHYLAHNNRVMANREKFISTLLSSCTQRPRRTRRHFSSHVQAEAYLRERFGISAPADEIFLSSNSWLQRRKDFNISETAAGTLLETPDTLNGAACFVFNQRIVARSRIMMLAMMARIGQLAPKIEICYANVDSIHFSLPSEHLERVLDVLRREACSAMGGYKIEAVAQSGLWLEPGRYWLYSNEIEKFRNRSVGCKGNAFVDHSIHVISRKIGELHVPIRMTLQMDRSMSDARSIVDDHAAGLARQKLIEIEDGASLSEILSALEHSRTEFIPRRMQAFRHLCEFFRDHQVPLPRDPAE